MNTITKVTVTNWEQGVILVDFLKKFLWKPYRMVAFKTILIRFHPVNYDYLNFTLVH